MNDQYRKLEDSLAAGLAAWRRSRWQRGAGLGLLGLLALAGLALLLRPFYHQATIWWWLVMAPGTLAWLILLWQYLILPLRRRPTIMQVARRLEEMNPDWEDRLATAVEFGRHPDSAENPLWDRLVEDAAAQAARVNFPAQLQLRFAAWWRALALATAGLAALLVLRLADLYQSQGLHYFDRSTGGGNVEGLQVEPGDARVPAGETVEVIVTTPEVEATGATIYLEQGREHWQPFAMNATTRLGTFNYHLYDVVDTLRYYVRVGEEISPIFTIVALAAPAVKGLRVTYFYPREIARPPKTEENGGDIYAPAGTEVQIEVTATQALAKAEWKLRGGHFAEMMRRSDTLATAGFTVTEEGSYLLRLTNHDGLSNKPVEYFIHVLPDEPPLITLLRPGRDLRPTMLEEVTLETLVREDFGLQQLTLIYTHNNQPGVRMDLLPQATRVQKPEATAVEYTASTVLYLEELGVQPGDFISYYYQARDARQVATSDLYFFEIRPFEEEFYRALSQAGGSAQPDGGLAISQKEIITATWKLLQRRELISAEEFNRGSTALAETQAGLQHSLERMTANAATRGQFTGENSTGKMTAYFSRAAEAMQQAVPLLHAGSLAEALVPEREAYRLLLQAEAELRRREIMQGAGSGSSFTQLQSREELAQLFKDELDKMQSQYETQQQQRQQEMRSGLTEAQQKVRELAQRQERLVELNRQLSRESPPPQERRRQLERLRREQEQINRELQNLSRQMRQFNSRSATGERQEARLCESLEQATRELQRSLDNLRRDDPAHAAAEGDRAVESLRQLQDRLAQQHTGSLREQLKALRDEFQQLAEQQGRLSAAVEDLQTQSSPAPSSLQGTQESLRAQSEQALERLRHLQESATDQPQSAGLARELRNVTNELEQRRLSERMAQAARALAQNELERALAEQNEARQALQRAEKALQRSLSQLAGNPEEQLDLALQETQRVRRNLEERLTESRASAEAALPPGQNPGRSASGERLPPEDMAQWQQQLWSDVRHLEEIGQFLRGDTALVDDYGRLLQNYRGVLRSFQSSDPQRLEEVERRLLEPMRRFEAELAGRLATLQLRERLLTIRDERVPPQYRRMVEEYFRKLAKGGQ
ncbi:MAG: hypothetical protein ONB48_00420 [candidate division KSB1 bacterium]|nr:hypothetical protein [candidate division KSB1 bacterium]MDZ7272860.1 hypothetical protein [candidate division KSB1 bacterium]MDZ7284117.1 hypothetical protein [candidate division KSB1 bacterium]MDZ7297485.1 hypothetical protein [candidate division KSB1 bacterium]MDZ7305621.1 hypothetical protein [candidate division KSB1 bacterium]